MGGNPSRDKNSKFGKELRSRWRTSGPLDIVSSPVNGSYNDSNGERIWWMRKWLNIQQTDLGHYHVSAVTYWNNEGYKYCPRAPEIRQWMNDPKNYRFEESSYNRSKGASSGEKYREPIKDDTQ